MNHKPINIAVIGKTYYEKRHFIDSFIIHIFTGTLIFSHNSIDKDPGYKIKYNFKSGEEMNYQEIVRIFLERTKLSAELNIIDEITIPGYPSFTLTEYQNEEQPSHMGYDIIVSWIDSDLNDPHTFKATEKVILVGKNTLNEAIVFLSEAIITLGKNRYITTLKDQLVILHEKDSYTPYKYPITLFRKPARTYPAIDIDLFEKVMKFIDLRYESEIMDLFEDYFSNVFSLMFTDEIIFTIPLIAINFVLKCKENARISCLKNKILEIMLHLRHKMDIFVIVCFVRIWILNSQPIKSIMHLIGKIFIAKINTNSYKIDPAWDGSFTEIYQYFFESIKKEIYPDLYYITNILQDETIDLEYKKLIISDYSEDMPENPTKKEIEIIKFLLEI